MTEHTRPWHWDPMKRLSVWIGCNSNTIVPTETANIAALVDRRALSQAMTAIYWIPLRHLNSEIYKRKEKHN